jgi:phosphohistidine swiveling domain-containing protein
MKKPKAVIKNISDETWPCVFVRPWHRMGEWKAPLLYEDIYCQGLRYGVPEFFPGVHGPRNFVHCCRISYQDVNEYADDAQRMSQIMIENPRVIRRLMSRFADRLANLKKYSQEGLKGRKAYSATDAKRQILRYLRYLCDIMPYSYVFNWGREAVIARVGKRLICPDDPNGKGHVIYSSCFDPSPPADALWMKEQWAVLDLAEQVSRKSGRISNALLKCDATNDKLKKDYPDLFRQLRQISRSYGCLGIRYMGGRPRGFLYYLDQLQMVLKMGISTKRQALASIGKKEDEQFNDYLCRSDITQLGKDFLTYARQVINVSTLRLEAISSSFHFIRPVFKKVGEYMGISPRLLLSCTWRELHDAIEKDILPCREELLARARGFAYMILGGKLYMVQGGSLRALKNGLGQIDKRDAFTLRGQGASAGFVVAKAAVAGGRNLSKQRFDRRVLILSDANEVDLDLIGSVAAIVADQGGILAKTASYARLMGIPCVVGTAIASQMVQEGDLLEVDGNIGVCRIRRERTLGSLE